MRKKAAAAEGKSPIYTVVTDNDTFLYFRLLALSSSALLSNWLFESMRFLSIMLQSESNFLMLNFSILRISVNRITHSCPIEKNTSKVLFWITTIRFQTKRYVSTVGISPQKLAFILYTQAAIMRLLKIMESEKMFEMVGKQISSLLMVS
ncbi:hypothetical protein CEY02_18735 [Bacillus pumilus]|uniref:Uncharacterized protein n=1 Tax=Bacillus pumilus TaxID=1408 RepID=A0A2A5IMF4_BACPU|nr:hypothetical protein [Bacillus pumilus]PCK18584.1 hypothetical protein CEY02_18735 [Bacillus pumilus]